MIQTYQQSHTHPGDRALPSLPHRAGIGAAKVFVRLACSFKGLIGAGLCVLLVAGLGPADANAPRASKTLQVIKQRGEIVVGVKTDFAPFGFLDAAGRPAGIEIDIAQKLAEGLGVSLQLQSVTTENRFQRLEQGLVDIIIAGTVTLTECGSGAGMERG